jgi:GTP-binding protein
MKIKKAEFIKGALKPSDFPKGLLAQKAQVAFSGRSNVGKSSLINKLLGRKKLARTSSTPGRTREINFFNINDELIFVDLPGYGYAKVPIDMRRSWRPMVEKYLDGNPSLRLVILIVDIRRDPKEEEISFLLWLDERDIPSLVVVTKTDKEKRGKVNGRIKNIAHILDIEIRDIVTFSAITGLGKDVLWTKIKEAVGA